MPSYTLAFVESGFGFGGSVTALRDILETKEMKHYRKVIIFSQHDSQSIALLGHYSNKVYVVPRYVRTNAVDKFLTRIKYAYAPIKLPIVFFIQATEIMLNLRFIVKVICILIKENVSMVSFNNQIKCEEIICSFLSKVPCVIYVRMYQGKSLLSKFISKYPRHFIVNSNYVKQSLLDLSIPEDKITVANCGIGFEKLKKDPALWREDRDFDDTSNFKIGIFGRTVEWKGQGVFIQAANALINDKKITNCKFYIVGAASEADGSNINALKNLADKLQIRNYIQFVGHKTNVFYWMNKMDLVVHASTIPEPFGLVIIEAMHCGKPVIATKHGGPVEIIENKVDGILIQHGDPNALANAIEELIKNESYRLRIAQNAKIKANERFNDTNNEAIPSIYERILHTEK